MPKKPYKMLPPLGQLVTRQLFEDGISQAELARRMCVSPQHLSNVITGKIYPQSRGIRKPYLLSPVRLFESGIGNRNIYRDGV